VSGLPAAAPSPSLDDWLAALRASQRQLTATVGRLTDRALATTSFASQWSCAQVLSHLGSGAEIFSNLLQAGLHGEEMPGGELFAAIWSRWDALGPREQATRAIRANDDLLAALSGLGPAARAMWRLPLYGVPGDLSYLVFLRLGEHAVHVWDIEVVHDDRALVCAPAVRVLATRLHETATRVAKPPAAPLNIVVTTQQPDRRYRIAATPSGVEVTASDSESEPGLPVAGEPVVMAAETWLRLVYGRLRADDEVHAAPDVLRQLVRLFPGF